MDVARLRGSDCNAAFELLVNDGEQVSPLNTYSVACFAPMAVELATEYHLNGYRVWRALQASRTRLRSPPRRRRWRMVEWSLTGVERQGR
jgi:hypothetical protein